MTKKQVKIITKIEPVNITQKPEMLNIKRVCAYCRVSTSSAEQNSSFESQVEYYTRLIDSKDGWVCVAIYADQARSGTKTTGRDDFQQMLRDCRLGKIDLILTKSVTRFARNTVDSIKAIRDLRSWGVEVYFEKERVSTQSEKSEQLLAILSSIAQGEYESISTNTRWANTYRFQNGTYTISCPAYGYVNNENGELVIQPEQAVIVRRIFNEYLDGKGSYAIARELQQEGLPTIRDAKGWRDSVVKGILQNLWNRLASNYQEILVPLLSALKAVPDDPEQEQETQELEQKIQEFRKQSYMLQKVLSDGGIGSAVFIGERNRIDTELDTAYRRLQLLKEQKLYEKEIGQTEYLITVCRNRPYIMEKFDEECFSKVIDRVTAYQDRKPR